MSDRRLFLWNQSKRKNWKCFLKKFFLRIFFRFFCAILFLINRWHLFPKKILKEKVKFFWKGVWQGNVWNSEERLFFFQRKRKIFARKFFFQKIFGWFLKVLFWENFLEEFFWFFREIFDQEKSSFKFSSLAEYPSFRIFSFFFSQKNPRQCYWRILIKFLTPIDPLVSPTKW